MRMYWEAQASLRLAQGDAWAEAEAQRMISEKVAALTEKGQQAISRREESSCVRGRVRRNRQRLAKKR
jgi:hypothetical protein